MVRNATGAASPWERVMPVYRHALVDLIVDYAVYAGSFELDEAYFLQRFARSEQVWRTGDHVAHVFVPLLNVQANHETSQTLAPGITWRALSNEAKARLWRVARPSRDDLTPFELARSDAVVVASFAVQRQLDEEGTGYQVVSVDTAPVLAAARRLVTALRLTHEGDVSIRSALSYFEPASLLRGAFPTRIRDLRTPDFDPFVSTTRFELSGSDLPVVGDLALQIATIESAGRLGSLAVALRWFHRSYSREVPEDRVIDLAVCLESSLLAGMTEQAELSYRLALRGAALLRGSESPEHTVGLLRSAYTVRSKIVHTGKTLEEISKQKQSPLKGRDFTTFAIDLRSCVRKILREYIRRMAEDVSHVSVETVNSQLEGDIQSALIARDSA